MHARVRADFRVYPMWLHVIMGSMDPAGHGGACQFDGQGTWFHSVMGKPEPVPAGCIEKAVAGSTYRLC